MKALLVKRKPKNGKPQNSRTRFAVNIILNQNCFVCFSRKRVNTLDCRCESAAVSPASGFCSVSEALCCFYQTFVIKSKLWTFRSRAVIVLTACENITYIKPLHNFKWIASLRVLFVALQETVWVDPGFFKEKIIAKENQWRMPTKCGNSTSA